MPRPMMPAPMTAMVRTSAIELLSLFQLLDDGEEVRVRLAHVFGEALLLVAADQIKACVDAAEGCRDIVHVVHHADQFTSSGHKSPFKRNMEEAKEAVRSPSVGSRGLHGTQPQRPGNFLFSPPLAIK